MTSCSVDVVIVGAGVIGLSVAWRAAQEGLTVAICDPEPARGASWAAAGMLAPTTEGRWGEGTLQALSQASANQWPAYASALEEDSGLPVGLRRDGTLSVALDADDYRVLEESFAVQREMGCNVELLTGQDCRRLEPSLNPRVAGGVLSAGDHQVDNRALLGALTQAVARRGVDLLRSAVRAIRRTSTERVAGVVLDDGTELAAGRVVVAAGWRSGHLGGLADGDVAPVRPVKGQILRLRSDPSVPVIGRAIRAMAQGRSVYLVPRASGEVVVGATVEERGVDTTVTVGAVYDLLRAAVAVVPDVAELELSEAMAGLRPGSPDNGPILGAASTPGLFLATGHYRNGILLAPLTSDALFEALSGRTIGGPSAAFSPQRFGVGEPAHEQRV
ncbi:MAG TPA: glycine oxidase ThiO [Acidimicrobiales bacterium]|nr:glycine oxidase ThiO [Acidimicrobiales bacterium]